MSPPRPKIPSNRDLTPPAGTPLPRQTLESLAAAFERLREDADELARDVEKVRSKVDAVAADHGLRVTAIERLLEHVGRPPDALKEGDLGTGLMGSVAYLVHEKQLERQRRARLVYGLKVVSAVVGLIGAAILVVLNLRSLIGH